MPQGTLRRSLMRSYSFTSPSHVSGAEASRLSMSCSSFLKRFRRPGTMLAAVILSYRGKIVLCRIPKGTEQSVRYRHSSLRQLASSLVAQQCSGEPHRKQRIFCCTCRSLRELDVLTVLQRQSCSSCSPCRVGVCCEKKATATTTTITGMKCKDVYCGLS